MDKNYYISRCCKNCGNKDDFYMGKKEKAFELYDASQIKNTPCSICQSKDWDIIGNSYIELDKELFFDWAFDDNLQFMQQDEDLLIADEKYVEIMLDLLDNYNILDGKRITLIEALCVIIYDSVNDKKNKSTLQSKEFLTRVESELMKRKDMVLKAETAIWDYVKDVVFPRIGIENKNE